MRVGKWISNYLRADELDRPMVVTVDSVELVLFEQGDGAVERLSLRVREIERPIVLNKTMVRQLAEFLGSEETDEWIGKRVILFRDPDVVYQGRRVGGIRFKPAPRDAGDPHPMRPSPSRPEPVSAGKSDAWLEWLTVGGPLSEEQRKTVEDLAGGELFSDSDPALVRRAVEIARLMTGGQGQ